MKKQYILWNSATGALAKRGNKFVVHEGGPPPTWDNYPRRFPSSAGWRFEEIDGVEVDRNHTGAAFYVQRDSQCARFTKIISPDEEK
jgi:hypothetical protein